MLKHGRPEGRPTDDLWPRFELLALNFAASTSILGTQYRRIKCVYIAFGFGPAP